MSHEYTDNNGTTFVNPNHCRSFNTTLAGSLTALVNETCAEVVFVNRSGADVLLYDNGYTDASNAFLLADGESLIFRGLTNANQLSANGTGAVYYRTQWYSNSPTR